MRPLLEDRGRITESIRILVPVDRMKQRCFQDGIDLRNFDPIRRSGAFRLTLTRACDLLMASPVPCQSNVEIT